MRQQTRQQLAVCSWSGQPDSPQTLIQRLEGMGLRRIQLALNPVLLLPAWRGSIALLRAAGVEVVSGMFETGAEDYSTPASIRATGGVGPDASFEATLARVPQYIALLDELGLDKVSFHAGFIPHDPAASGRAMMCARLKTLATRFAAAGKCLLLETGQETAQTLCQLLRELGQPTLKVNFDPGNMLLYSMGDPIVSLELLLPHIAQVHIKDAIASGNPEQWGREMSAGSGQVDWPRFFAILARADYTGDLVIERECGNDPVGEIRRAVAYLDPLLTPEDMSPRE
ncbi:MAG: sugar phosphate isomerase/epimerase [Puniceicoccales bacterium]|jgi:sugar phosphate isomerase/epimerase|nr:sugar phosphate isomerase/epimerase [Puniceicoccales bacterium]